MCCRITSRVLVSRKQKRFQRASDADRTNVRSHKLSRREFQTVGPVSQAQAMCTHR